jgi:hypothetical protein
VWWLVLGLGVGVGVLGLLSTGRRAAQHRAPGLLSPGRRAAATARRAAALFEEVDPARTSGSSPGTAGGRQSRRRG